MNEGAKELAGASACRWYINEDIEEINILLASTLESPFRPILHLHTPRCMTLRALVPGPYPIKELMELANIDLLQNQGSIFMCIVTIWRLALGQRWWVTCCPRCGHASVPIRSSSANLEGYQCSNNQCTSMEAMPQQHGSGQVCLAWKSFSGYNWPFP